MTGFIAWLTSWLLLIILLMVLAQRSWGHTIVYYVLWMSVLFVVVTQGKSIASIFESGDIDG